MEAEEILRWVVDMSRDGSAEPTTDRVGMALNATHRSGLRVATGTPNEWGKQIAPASSFSWQEKYARVLAVTDLLSVLLAVGFAQLVRFGASPQGRPNAASGLDYFEVSIAIAVCWFAALSIGHSRSHRIVASGIDEYRRVWLATISVFGAVAIVSMLFKLEIARGYLMIALPAGLTLLFASRWVGRKIVCKLRRDFGKCNTRLLVVGSPQAVRDLAAALWREPWSGYDVVGACIPGRPSRTEIGIPGLGSIPVLGDESRVLSALVASKCHAVAVATNDEFHGKGLRDLSWDLEGLDIDLMVAPGVIDVAGPRLHMRPVAGLPLIHVEKPQYHGAKRFLKRAFDIGFAGSALLFGLPIMLMIALAIKLSSKGPVFYRHRRIGLDGKPFDMIKFRSMVIGADTMADVLSDMDCAVSPRDAFKSVNDPRVTRLGRFLRKYSLDELPQFINVLKRDMSIVGPRPQVTREVELYDAVTMRRLLVRPGITGLWQISGRSDLSWEDAVRLDLFYVENWSMMADVVITFKTLKVVLNSSGAY